MSGHRPRHRNIKDPCAGLEQNTQKFAFKYDESVNNKQQKGSLIQIHGVPPPRFLLVTTFKRCDYIKEKKRDANTKAQYTVHSVRHRQTRYH